MRPRYVLSLALLLTLLAARPAAAANKLWIAWSPETAGCKAQVEAFYDCLLNDTDYNQLAATYPGGLQLSVAGTAVLSQSCSEMDFTCIVNNAGFAITQDDVVLYYYGSQPGDGWNDVQMVNGVNIYIASVQGGQDCDNQTCLGSHETYEASTDGISADCCNGQVQTQWCPNCNASCGQNQNDAGCYQLQCPNGTFSMERLSPKSNEFDNSGCTELTIGNACKPPQAACASDGDCCQGFTCKPASATGAPPYQNQCCKAQGQACNEKGDCCGGTTCQGGTCACAAEGQACAGDSDCCAPSACNADTHVCSKPAAGTGSTSSSSSSSSSTTTSGGVGGGPVNSTGSGIQVGGGDPGDANDGEPRKGGCSLSVEGTSSEAPLFAALAALALAQRRRLARDRRAA